MSSRDADSSRPGSPVVVGPNSEAGALTFDVDAALLFELGEQLVTRKSVALAELVKNAYDADATNVQITFNQVRDSAGGSIGVADNGSGMSLDTVRDGWMRIATTAKRDGAVSPRFHRPVTGAKGVGRFAARKLAGELVLDTRARTGPTRVERTVVYFDWAKFEPGSELTEIPSLYEHEPDVPGEPGTSLRLDGLREVWTLAEINAVRDDLRTLTPPFSSFLSTSEDRRSRGGFDVSIVAPEFPEAEGSLNESFLSAAASRLRGRVERNGVPTYELKSRGVAGVRKFSPADARWEAISGAAFEVHYFKYDRESLAGTGVTVGTARELGATAGGVKIYLDGFRVFPYGDPGDDWLSLDADRGRRLTSADRLLRPLVSQIGSRSLLNLPGSNNLFGAVFATRALQPGLQPTISRERLAQTRAFAELERFVRVGIEWMVVERSRLEQRGRNARKTRQPAASVESTLNSGVAALKADLPSLVVDPKGLTERLEELREKVITANEMELEKVRVLRILASAGTMMLVFVHQLRATIDGLRRLIRDLRKGGPAAKSALDRLERWVGQLEAQAAELGLLLGKRSRSDSRELAVSPIVEQVIETFAGYSQDHNILVENAVPSGLRTPPIREAELHAILINLLTNALKAVKGSPDRRIRFEGHRRGGDLVIGVLDTGPGVPAKDRERVFDPFETTSAPDPVLGVGTGLGLTIVRDIVDEHSGRVRFIEAMPDWGAHIEVVLPPSVSK